MIVEPINEHQFYYDDGDDIYNVTLVNCESIFIFADKKDYESILHQIEDGAKIIKVLAMIDGGEHTRECHIVANNIVYIIECHQRDYHYEPLMDDNIKADENTLELYY